VSVAELGLPVAIALPGGLSALVDTADAEWLSCYRWRAMRIRHTWYATRATERGGRKRTIYLHRAVYERHHGPIPAGRHIDHIDGNGLNNLPSNLRAATNAQNLMNARPRRGSSRYKGVDWHKASRSWRARIHPAEGEVVLGYFDNEPEAAQAYNEAARQFYGAFARLNVIEEKAA